jgi:hypothetical protein
VLVLSDDPVNMLNDDGGVAASQRSIDNAVGAAHKWVRLCSSNQDADCETDGVSDSEKGVQPILQEPGAEEVSGEGIRQPSPEERLIAKALAAYRAESLEDQFNRLKDMNLNINFPDVYRGLVRAPAAIRVSSRNSISVLEQPLFPDMEWVQYAAERFSDVRQLHYRLSSNSSSSSDWAAKLAELLPEAVQAAEAVMDGGLLFGSGRETAYRRLTSSSSSSSSRRIFKHILCCLVSPPLRYLLQPLQRRFRL